MAERSNAAVLKTVDLHGSGGSNPSLSAKEKAMRSVAFFCELEFSARMRSQGCDRRESLAHRLMKRFVTAP